MRAGVARQWRGALGKAENRQARLTLDAVGDKGYRLLSARLDMPEKWRSNDDGYN
jgi:SRSO17 transposase